MPRDISGIAVGGPKKLTLNTEFLAPFPGAGNDRTLRMFGYFDAGNVWNDEIEDEHKGLRASVGFGISWISPVGPLKLSWGQPVVKYSTDSIQKLQFQIGSTF